jgi:hypothetical protein
MIFYIPSLFILLLSAVFIFAFVPNVTPVLLAIIAIASLAFALYHHNNLFFNEYKNMNWTNTAGMAAPYIVVGTIILLSIGYILLLVTSGKAPSLPTFSTSIPPPSTATNSLTRAIGNSLVATKAVNVAPSINTAQRNLLESGLSKAV